MKLTNREFKEVRDLLYDYCGIWLHEGKVALVRARLMKRLRKLQLTSFTEYLNYIESDRSGAEFLTLIDLLTTNKTDFFRESRHFDFLRNEVIPAMDNREVQWWSAGCSTGEEAISCAITVLEEQRLRTSMHNDRTSSRVKILATDLSRDVLQVARAGSYAPDRLAGIPGYIRRNYFYRTEKGAFKVAEPVRRMITYGRLNLKTHWPLKKPFHVIMCRNVMIYFNRKSRQDLMDRFYHVLEPDGYLFLGHSESIQDNRGGFRNINPAVYQRA